MSIELVRPSNHLILCHPLLLPPSIFSSIWVFSNESVLHMRWPKYWSFSSSISPSNEYSGLISFRMHWLDLLAVQEILKSIIQYHSSKASILWCSAFFIVQHSHVTTGKTIALTRQTFVGKVMTSLVFCLRFSLSEAFLLNLSLIWLFQLHFHVAFEFYFILKRYKTVLVLPNIEMCLCFLLCCLGWS